MIAVRFLEANTARNYSTVNLRIRKTSPTTPPAGFPLAEVLGKMPP
jgi:hypothetical protein